MAVAMAPGTVDHCDALAPRSGTDDEGHERWRPGCGSQGIAASLDATDLDAHPGSEEDARALGSETGLPTSVPQGPDGTSAADRPSDANSVGSKESELECPVCYHTFCEPVRAGCDRHVFCRQCLWRTQRPGEPLRCPICRASAPGDAEKLAEVSELAAKLMKRDPNYEERRASAVSEREDDIRRMRDMRALLQELAARPNEDMFNFEVVGAGCEESNGVYVVDVLPTYLGPTVYRKPNTHFFIYRWHRTQWVIAELREQSRMGNERAWLYAAPTQVPPHIPPATGWEVPRRSGGALPAPEVRRLPRDLVGATARQSSPQPPAAASPAAAQQARHVAPRSSPTVQQTGQATRSSNSAEQAVAVREADAAAPCGCSPQCSVM